MLQRKLNGGPRWPRGQRFSLSLAGREAQREHQAAVLSARGLSRSSLDAALAAWAAPRQVQAADGVVLGELVEKPRGLSEVTRILEQAGTSPSEVRDSLARLIDAGLVELVPPSSRDAANTNSTPPVRWAGS